jgi:hypothetical protein
MSPLVSHHAVATAFLGLLLAVLVVGLADALIRALKRSAARRRSVLGRRVPMPEWRARRNHRNEWIVERVR